MSNLPGINLEFEGFFLRNFCALDSGIPNSSPVCIISDNKLALPKCALVSMKFDCPRLSLCDISSWILKLSWDSDHLVESFASQCLLPESWACLLNWEITGFAVGFFKGSAGLVMVRSGVNTELFACSRLNVEGFLSVGKWSKSEAVGSMWFLGWENLRFLVGVLFKLSGFRRSAERG